MVVYSNRCGGKLILGCLLIFSAGAMSTSDKIDKLSANTCCNTQSREIGAAPGQRTITVAENSEAKESVEPIDDWDPEREGYE